jgi:hypothetical protein
MRSYLLFVAVALTGCIDRYNITITQLQITNDGDGSGTPEIEVYLFDEDDDLIGCAGTRQGLGGVDVAGVRYELDARMIDDEQDTDIAVGGGALRFEVWEDDDDPVCPRELNPDGNDYLGASPPHPIGKWITLDDQEMQFGEVSAFSVRFD